MLSNRIARYVSSVPALAIAMRSPLVPGSCLTRVTNAACGGVSVVCCLFVVCLLISSIQ